MLGWTVGAGALLGLGQLSGPGGVSAHPDPGPTSSLRCPRNDLILSMYSVRGGGSSGRSASPEQALSREISPRYANLPAKAFRRSQANSAEVTLVHESRARIPVAKAEVVRQGKGWAVERFTACNSTLKGSAR